MPLPRAMEDGSRKVSVNVGPIESNLSKKDEIAFLMDGGNDADAAVDVETEVNDGAADTDDDDDFIYSFDIKSIHYLVKHSNENPYNRKSIPIKYKSIINHPTDNYDYEEQLENEKIKFYED